MFQSSCVWVSLDVVRKRGKSLKKARVNFPPSFFQSSITFPSICQLMQTLRLGIICIVHPLIGKNLAKNRVDYFYQNYINFQLYINTQREICTKMLASNL